MKISSINNINYKPSKVNFKSTAVPYPEYPNAYNVAEKNLESTISTTIEKLAHLFSPKVTKEAMEIKSDIDSIYSDSAKKAAKKRLLSVLA